MFRLFYTPMHLLMNYATLQFLLLPKSVFQSHITFLRWQESSIRFKQNIEDVKY
jgi:hypothetical protein